MDGSSVCTDPHHCRVEHYKWLKCTCVGVPSTYRAGFLIRKYFRDIPPSKGGKDVFSQYNINFGPKRPYFFAFAKIVDSTVIYSYIHTDFEVQWQRAS